MTDIALCECGCGEPAPLAMKTWPSRGWVAGESMRFVHGHSLRIFKPDNRRRFDADQSTIPPCACGCGERVGLATQTNRKIGLVKGQPTRYRRGHGPTRKITEDDYILTDTGYPSPCWIWRNRDVSNDGYARVTIRGKKVSVHRLMYELHVGPIPPGFHVHHCCEMRPCVRPDHLQVLSASEHMQLQSRLTKKDIQAIRASTESHIALARRYGVGKSTIGRIVRGMTWHD